MMKNQIKDQISEKEKKIRTKDEFLDFYKKFSVDIEKKMLFRGQSNASGSIWPLNSSLRRSLSKTNENLNNIDSEWDENLISDCYDDLITKLCETDHENDPNILRILSDLQHSGFTTFLIDFTNSLDVALWFAFSEVGLKEHTDTKETQAFSSIFIKEIENDDICYSLQKEKVSNVNADGNIKFYSCPPNNQRGISQRSYFAIDNLNFHESAFEKYLISHKLKKTIIDFLDKKGINEEVLFPDSSGVARKFMSEDVGILLLKIKKSIVEFLKEGKTLDMALTIFDNYEEQLKLSDNSKYQYFFLKAKVHKEIFLDSLLNMEQYSFDSLFSFENNNDCYKNYNLAIEFFDKQVKINHSTTMTEKEIVYSIICHYEKYLLLKTYFEHNQASEITEQIQIWRKDGSNNYVCQSCSDQEFIEILKETLKQAINLYNNTTLEKRKDEKVWVNIFNELLKETENLNTILKAKEKE